MKVIYVFLWSCLMGGLVACQSEKTFDATGIFESTEVIVSAEANGKLLTFEVEEGMVLEEGDVVGVIDTLQLYLKKCQLEATKRSVNYQRPDISRQIAATREQIAVAQRERKRAENLWKVNAANRKQLDDWDAQLAVLEKQLAAQISTLGNADNSLTEQGASVEIQILQVEDLLNKCRVAVPLGGTVLAKYAEQGELAVTGKPLFKVADMKHVFLRAYVTSRQLATVELGKEVKVFADFGGDTRKEYVGKVSWIADEAEFTPKTILTDDERAELVYAVKVAVENDGTIKLGMYGEVKF